MIAQLSQSEPSGSPSSSSNGVRSAGSLARNSEVLFLPQTSTSSKSSPAARTKIRAVRLLTLGLRMLRVLAAMCCLLGGVEIYCWYGSWGDRSSDSDSRERVT